MRAVKLIYAALRNLCLRASIPDRANISSMLKMRYPAASFAIGWTALFKCEVYDATGSKVDGFRDGARPIKPGSYALRCNADNSGQQNSYVITATLYTRFTQRQ